MTNIKEIKAGDIVEADAGFTCLSQGRHLVQSSDSGLFISCSNGKHFIDGQVDDDGTVIGLKLVSPSHEADTTSVA